MTTTTAPDLSTAEFVYEVLVTDTRIYEVVGRTAATLKLRPTRSSGRSRRDESCDQGAYGLSVVWDEQAPNPDGPVFTVRRRKDGTYRLGTNPLRPVVGTPERRIDYRY